MLTSEGELKLADFGLSKGPEHKDANGKLSEPVGTPTYMCPELIHQLPYVGQVADIWALGIVLFIMVAANFPFMEAASRD